MKISLGFYILWVLLFQYSIAIPIKPGPNDHSQHSPADPQHHEDRLSLPPIQPQYQPPGPNDRPNFGFSSNHRVGHHGPTVVDPNHGNPHPPQPRYQPPGPNDRPNFGFSFEHRPTVVDPNHGNPHPPQAGPSQAGAVHHHYDHPGQHPHHNPAQQTRHTIDSQHHRVGQHGPTVVDPNHGNPHPPQAGPSQAGAPPVDHQHHPQQSRTTCRVAGCGKAYSRANGGYLEHMKHEGHIRKVNAWFVPPDQEEQYQCCTPGCGREGSWKSIRGHVTRAHHCD